MDRELLAVKIRPWTERFKPGPSCFSEVAEKFGRTIFACVTRYHALRTKRGPWTKIGLWTAEEDSLILAQIRGVDRVEDGTWIDVSFYLDRTVPAIRTRACNLRKRAVL